MSETRSVSVAPEIIVAGGAVSTHRIGIVEFYLGREDEAVKVSGIGALGFRKCAIVDQVPNQRVPVIREERIRGTGPSNDRGPAQGSWTDPVLSQRRHIRTGEDFLNGAYDAADRRAYILLRPLVAPKQ